MDIKMILFNNNFIVSSVVLQSVIRTASMATVFDQSGSEIQQSRLI